MKNIILSVITSFYDRSFVLYRYKQFISRMNDPRIEFVLIDWNDSDGVFSTAKCHNAAVLKSKGQWIQKMDIDCYCDPIMFCKILDLVKDKDDTFFANFGCKGYLGDIGFPQGNQYLCSKKAYTEVGGEPEFIGYGSEDYCFLYKLAKYADKNFKLEYSTPVQLSISIHENLARKLNKTYKDIYFIHQDHARNTSLIKYFQENKNKMFEICKKLDGQ